MKNLFKKIEVYLKTFDLKTLEIQLNDYSTNTIGYVLFEFLDEEWYIYIDDLIYHLENNSRFNELMNDSIKEKKRI